MLIAHSLRGRKGSGFKSRFYYQSCVAMGKWLNISVPPFSDLEKEDITEVTGHWNRGLEVFQAHTGLHFLAPVRWGCVAEAV